jgi:diaminopimelate epimerase
MDPAVTGSPATYTVDMPGGRLVITERVDGTVEMTGPAVIVAEGLVDPAWLDKE